MRLLVVLGLMAACGRHGFEARDGSVTVDTSSLDDAIMTDVLELDDAPRDTAMLTWQSFSPIGYYPFDGTGADLAYPSGTTACTGCTYQAGHRGQGVLAPSPTALPNRPLGSADFTVAYWLYVPADLANNFSACGTVLTAHTNIEGAEGPSRITLFSPTSNFIGAAAATITGDTWVHVTMESVASTRDQHLVIDGTYRGTASAIMADSLTPTRLGGGDCGLVIDELFLFDRLLSATEIAGVRDL